MIIEEQVASVEEYLVKVWVGAKSKTMAKTFDQLRLEKYLSGSGIDALPPTSSSIRGHIFRGGLLIYSVVNLLNDNIVHLDPREFAWEESNGMMLPSQILKIIPACKLCKCSCGGLMFEGRVSNEKCTLFCHDKKTMFHVQIISYTEFHMTG